jgi:(p)ppGpp synthase/HD superfamily hydrolase
MGVDPRNFQLDKLSPVCHTWHMSQVLVAELIARQAHAAQEEPQTALPYITHVERVVQMVEGDDAKAVAWLHDVLEDTPVTAEDLWAAGISEEVLLAVQALTRRDDETYRNYILRVQASGPLARAVKLADLRDHLRPSEYLKVSLRSRYQQALHQLTGDTRNADDMDT